MSKVSPSVKRTQLVAVATKDAFSSSYSFDTSNRLSSTKYPLLAAIFGFVCTIVNGSECPCWTDSYLDEVEAHFRALGRGHEDFDVFFQSNLGPRTKNTQHAYVGIPEGSSYSLHASEHPAPQKRYKCGKHDNRYIGISEEEFGHCLDDILEMEKSIEAGLCRVATNEAETCPCWPYGFPDDVSTFNYLRQYGDITEATLTFLGTEDSNFNRDTYRVTGWTNKQPSCDRGLDGVYPPNPDRLTEQEFNKCYNDILRKTCMDGRNYCAMKSGACASSATPSPSESLTTTTTSVRSVDVESKMMVRFFEGYEGEPTQSDVDGLIPQIVAFFRVAASEDPYLAGDVLQFDVMETSHKYDADSGTFLLEFVSHMDIAVVSERTTRQIFVAFGEYNLQEFIMMYAWMAEPYKENQFYQTQWVYFAWNG